MTAAQDKIVRETQGVLQGIGCRLERAGGDQFRIVKSGKILGTGTLSTCYESAKYMVSCGRFEPEPVATGSEAYQAGRAMSERLKGK